LLLDHFKKIAMVNYPLKNRTKSQSVMAAEGSGKAYDWYGVRQLGRLKGCLWIPYCRIEVRENSTISE